MLLHEILQNGRGEDIAVIDRGRRITYDDLREALQESARTTMSRSFPTTAWSCSSPTSH